MKELNITYKERKNYISPSEKKEAVRIRCQLKSEHRQVSRLTGVYAIVNDEIETAYIGQSCNLDGRIKNHKSCLNNNKHPIQSLQEDYNNFKEGFRFEVICHSEDDTDLLSLETSNISSFIARGYRVYNTVLNTENPLAHTVICSTKEHQRILSRLNKLLQKGKIQLAQIDYSLDVLENQF